MYDKMTVEVIFMPVTDVDRAKDLYVNKLGLAADQDNKVKEGLRFVQLTPEGSACSIAFGEGITEAWHPTRHHDGSRRRSRLKARTARKWCRYK
jgi:catechol 2,3-dioxygenase-like lactoylglutathione lyase family enzyme